MAFRIIHHVDQATVDRMYAEYAPVFILSTGRSGTKLAASLLDAASNVQAFHEPAPTLMHLSHFAFHHQEDAALLARIVEAARMELVLGTYIMAKLYVEANQCLTFLAPSIAGLFRNARFVHLARHPADFVRSAIRKGWHRNDTIWESGRVKMADPASWERLDQIERLAWVWAATHRYLSGFRQQIGPARALFLRLEDLVSSPEAVRELFRFVGANELEANEVRRFQAMRLNELRIDPDEPPNLKKVDRFPAYHLWPRETKEKLHSWCAETAAELGYEVE